VEATLQTAKAGAGAGRSERGSWLLLYTAGVEALGFEDYLQPDRRLCSAFASKGLTAAGAKAPLPPPPAPPVLLECPFGTANAFLFPPTPSLGPVAFASALVRMPVWRAASGGGAYIFNRAHALLYQAGTVVLNFLRSALTDSIPSIPIPESVSGSKRAPQTLFFDTYGED
jgi:hypothetical protein